MGVFTPGHLHGAVYIGQAMAAELGTEHENVTLVFDVDITSVEHAAQLCRSNFGLADVCACVCVDGCLGACHAHARTRVCVAVLVCVCVCVWRLFDVSDG